MKDIIGFEGHYAITEDGQVWSHKNQRFLKPYRDNRGYLKVDLRNGEIRKQCRVHRLVAEAFIPNPFGLDTVNHIDENKENNCVDNLEWMSVGDNVRYGTGSQRSGMNRRKKIYCVELCIEYDSLTQASGELDLNMGGLSKAIDNPNRTCGGYHWESRS